jgi:DNA-binding SARP family transcriptional activator/tetratricopeptide (TPR) repeat protein/DNA-binding XRE family transcriptional regulator
MAAGAPLRWHPAGGRVDGVEEHGPRPQSELGLRLRTYREAAGLTQGQLAEQSGLSAAAVQDIEQGRTTRPRSASVTRLARALHLRADQHEELAALSARPATPQRQRPPARDGNGQPGLRLEILGPVAAWRDGTPVPLGSIRQRAVLVLLALHAEAGLSRAAVIDALWSGEPPETAVTMVQGYITWLRHLLGPGGAAPAERPSARGSVLAWDGALYRLAPGAVDSDLNEFTELAERAQQAAPGDPARACQLYEAAMRLWRGDAAADIELLHGHPAVIEINQRRAAVTIDYATVADVAGLHEPIVTHLRALASRAPLDERAHARLMVALAATGQQASALDIYENLRRRLHDELGVRPSRELTDAHLLVLREQVTAAGARPGAGPAPTADAGGPAGTSGAAGQSAGRGGNRGPAAADRPVPRQLPAPVRHFAGRAGELQMLSRLLDHTARQAPGTVVISAIGGTAGVGKTALAVHWAHRIADRFPDGQLYVNLRGFDPSGTPVAPADAIRRFLDALRVPARQIPSTAEAQQDLYRSLLADRRMLIVLDNARNAEQVRPLLPGGLGCLVLVTSRSQLTSLVAVEGAHPVTLDLLNPADARELLVRRLGPARIMAEADDVTELTELCAGLPLALAIAAARAALLPSLPLATLVAGLREAGTRLDVLDAGDPAASVRAVFSWSYRHLPEPAARMFRLLGVHPGPDITAAAAASLAAVPLAPARQALRDLTQASLLAEPAPDRLTFHDLLRTYAAERAATEDSRPDRHAAIHRALDHYVNTADAASLILNPHRGSIRVAAPRPGVTPEDIDSQAQATSWFEAEHRVLLAVLGQAVEDGFDVYAWQLPLTLATFLNRCGDWHQYLATHQTALAAGQRLGDLEAQAAVYRNLGHASMVLGAYQDAEAHHGQALESYRRLGDQTGMGRAHLGLGSVIEHQSRHRDAIVHFERALALFRSTGDQNLLATALNNIGWCHTELGNYTQALDYCQQALALHQKVGDPFSQAADWDSLGYTRQLLGQHTEALACYQQALALTRALADRPNQAQVLVHLGDAHDAVGEPGAARAAWQQALDILDDLRHPAAEQVRAKLRETQPTKVTQSR